MSRLLIVDDEEVLTASLQDILEGEGHRVLTAPNGMNALDTLARERLDLVLLDLMPPLVDGLTVLRTLRRDAPSTAVLVVTSCAREALQGQSVQGFLRKPFSLKVLLHAVKAALPPEPPTRHEAPAGLPDDEKPRLPHE